MISRETKVQIAAALLGLGILAAGFSLMNESVWWAEALVIALYNAAIFGGTHAYFVLRGGGGDYSLTARKRLLTLLAALFVLIPATVVVGDRTVGPLALKTMLFVAAGVAVLWYFVVEGIAGYQATMAGE
ncbi:MULTISPECIES: hypothetical protein [Halomicrobium]|uniref:Uncharacterized protein n=2 Tax=Halomicrobium mukohataei TaxID=57705 RepID=C7NYX9_HALMD|nr:MULTISPECIES: hypothetical protein [Halomicrobium]ACV48668.1 conserved hypothetical protein [Halomicrobium mukohataei DSM 12286]QCD64099.1 hypothetical protein E5139_00075 [Halomicrobium mukohataei]QFR18905.1 hypothetical protein GBQ70_00075 [Halomicrobium sp. ZPS1]